MKSKLKKLLLTMLEVIGGLVIGVIAFIFIQAIRHKELQSAYTHQEVRQINPVMVIDRVSLTDVGNFKDTMQGAVTAMVKRGILMQTPFGLVYNPSLGGSNYSVNVIIQSGGGFVNLGYEALGFLNEMRKNGLKINCHVAEAQSMAFTIMVLGCDKVIAKKTATIMQHRTSYGGGNVTPSTFNQDIEIAEAEALRLGVKYDEWLALTKGKEDHVFTKEEIEKYKLVDEWID